MGKRSKQVMDHALAEELGLTLSPFTLTVERICKVARGDVGLVFAWQGKEGIYFDRAIHYNTCNGLRLKIDYFALTHQARRRLDANHYHRWYVYSEGQLFVIQTSKVERLLNVLCFRSTEDILCPTQNIVVVEEMMGLRKKPLQTVRTSKVTWEDCQAPIEQCIHRKPTPARMGMV